MSEDSSGSGYVQQEFTRDSNYLPDRITADGSTGWPVEPGRYHLVVARACPWANRALIVRRLLGLEPVISMGMCGPTHDERSWTFDLDPGGRDPVLGRRLVECARALTGLEENDPVRVFGPVDAQKLHSSMTLFACAVPEESVFREVLDQYFGGALDEGTTSRV